MRGLRVRWKAVLPAVGVVGGILASPQVLAILPDKWAHAAIAVGALAAIFTPAAVTNKPPSDGNVANGTSSDEYFRGQ